MNNMNKSPKWFKYKNKATGDIVEARPNTKFPEYQLLRWDEGVFGGVKTCTSMLVTDFEKGYIKYTATSYSITDNGSHFNLNLFVSNVEKYENGSNVIVTNFIEFKTEKDFMDFKWGGL